MEAISFARRENAANGATKNSPKVQSALIRPPQSPSQSKKLYVSLSIFYKSLSNRILALEYLYYAVRFFSVGNVFQELGLTVT